MHAVFIRSYKIKISGKIIIFIVSHVTVRIKHPFFIIFFHYLRDHKFDTIVRVMLLMLRKNTRNNIIIGGMYARVQERSTSERKYSA